MAHTKRCIERIQHDPWWGPLQEGLSATAAIHAAARPFTVSGDTQSVWG